MSSAENAQVRLVPLAAEEFEAWAAHSRDGFAAQQVDSGTLPAAEATAYAREALDALLPHGPHTPDHHLWSVTSAGTGESIGHLWIRISPHSDGLDCFLYDIELAPTVRGRGLGRATMLAAEEAARDLGATRIRLNVFGQNHGAHRLYESLGYRPVVTMLSGVPTPPSPWVDEAAHQLRVVPLAPGEYVDYRPRAQAARAARMESSGMLPREEARATAREDLDRLLPRRETPGQLLWVCVEGDRRVAVVWVGLEDRSDGVRALVHHVETAEPDGPQSPAVLLAVWAACRAEGAESLALEVWGADQERLRRLEGGGLAVSARLMRKELR